MGTLRGQLLDACGSAAAWRALWAVDSEEAANDVRQLASYAAAGYYGPKTCAYASQCQSTLERLEVAVRALGESERRGLTMLALQRATSPEARAHRLAALRAPLDSTVDW